MALPGRFESKHTRHAVAGVASIAIHLIVIGAALLFGGRHQGVGHSDQPISQLVLIEAPDVDRTEGLDLTPLEAAVAAALAAEQMNLNLQPEPPTAATEAVTTEPSDQQFALPEVPIEATAELAAETIQALATFPMSAEEKASLPKRLARAAEEQQSAPQTQLEWEENGKRYSAKLVRERAKDGTALEHVIAEVSASDRGRILSTRIMLKRLAFSQFTQVVDRWDPMVQLHDDVIVGRFHSNSQFNVMYDSRVGPKVLGKVTTAARSFEMTGRRRQAEVFPNGVETRTRRIDLPDALQPFAWAPEDAEARIHKFDDDTRIRFFADGSYMWRVNGSPEAEYLNAPSEHPVYFIAGLGTTLYVQGVVAGNILVYSPQKIVIESALTYAHDPHKMPHSRDYLGLVSDKFIEVAPPEVTGPGDLRIDAAIFAGRRFLVRDIDHSRSATMRIYGSLSAGSISASEPRYATQIEYDERFERKRPPGFPMTSRYEAEDSDGLWVEEPERAADIAF